MWILGLKGLSSDVFERRTSTGSGFFALFGRDFEQKPGQIVSVRVKTLSKFTLQFNLIYFNLLYKFSGVKAF